MRRWGLLTLLLLASAGVVCLVGGPEAPELIYEGKPLGQWLDAGYEDTARVVYDVGPRAAECIFAKLKREHPRYGRWGRYRWVYDRLPAFSRKLLPRPRASGFDEWRACNALLAIGPAAIPSLGRSLTDGHFLVRSVSAQTLGLFRQRGSNIAAAGPALEAASHDPDRTVREQASAALGR